MESKSLVAFLILVQLKQVTFTTGVWKRPTNVDSCWFSLCKHTSRWPATNIIVCRQAITSTYYKIRNFLPEKILKLEKPRCNKSFGEDAVEWVAGEMLEIETEMNHFMEIVEKRNLKYHTILILVKIIVGYAKKNSKRKTEKKSSCLRSL